jgi:hypothetical protein
MAVRQFDAVAEIQSAFQILTKNWMLAIPPGIASLVATVFMVMVFGTAIAAVGLGAYGSTGGLLGMLGALGGLTIVGVVVVGLVFLIAHATVMASAQEVWAGRPVDLGASLGRALACLPNLVIAGLLVGLMIGITVFTIVGWIAVIYLMMFVLPAIVIGGHNAISAIGESWRVTTKNFGPSITAFGGIVLAGIVAAIANNIFMHVIGLNFIISLVVGGFLYAFAALVAVRFYDLLRGTEAPAA